MKDFAGVWPFSDLNPFIVKGAVVAVALGICSSVFAQELATGFDPVFGFYRPELLAAADSESLLRELPMNSFLDGRVPGSTPLGRMGSAPVENFPIALVSAQPTRKTAHTQRVTDPKDGKDYSSAEAFAAEKASLSWTGGEVGFLYGHSAGKFGGDELSSYIVGSVGNEHLQITAGAAYEEFNGRVPRWRP